MAASVEKDETQNFIKAVSAQSFRYKEQVQNTIRNAFPGTATDQNVEIIGRSRNTPKLKGEIAGEYKNRVLNAFPGNQGRGNLADIVLIMKSLGFTPFNGTLSGDLSGGVGSFNIILSTAGGPIYDNTFLYDDTITYSSPKANEITIEIVQVPITSELNKIIRDALAPILRASMGIFAIIEI